MPRILLATEGPVDEIVISALCVARLSCVPEDITAHSFPARGIAQVLRLASAVVRRAHFGHFDLLVLHADADSTVDHEDHDKRLLRCQLCELESCVGDTLQEIQSQGGRTAPLVVRYAFPKQSTDAWLLWGRDGGAPSLIEARIRHEVKRDVFEGATFGHRDRARALMPKLLQRLRTDEPPPPSLAAFWRWLLVAGSPPSAYVKPGAK